LIIGLRGWDVGWDTRNYIYFFEKYGSMNFISLLSGNFEIEKGYLIFQYFLFNIYSHPTLLFSTIATIYIISVSSFIYRNSKYPLLSYLIFISMGYFTFSMTALRQTIAIAIILFSYNYLKEKKLLGFLILVLIASTFHYSAIVFLPFYFISKIKVTRLYMFLSIPIIVVTFLFREPIFKFLSTLSGYNYSPISTDGPATLFSLFLIVYVVSIALSKAIDYNKLENRICYHAIFLSIIFTVLAFIHPAALRISYYFSFFIIIFIPEIIRAFKTKELRFFIFIAASIILIVLYLLNINPSSPFVPYDFFW
jgi:transmembrane protein EpsG